MRIYVYILAILVSLLLWILLYHGSLWLYTAMT